MDGLTLAQQLISLENEQNEIQKKKELVKEQLTEEIIIKYAERLFNKKDIVTLDDIKNIISDAIYDVKKVDKY